MGEYARPRNPQTVPSTKIRVFDGIGGPPTQILKRFNFKGWDLSNTVANDVTDLHLSEKGSALLRPGMRRLGSEDYTIGWIGQITIGGLLRYGTIYNNSLTMIDMPMQMGYDLIEWPEDEYPSRPSFWPTVWRWISDPVDSHLPEDPSLPVENQVCAIEWEWTASPDTLSFTMPYAGAITPTSAYWCDQVVGYRPNTPLSATYNVDAAWFASRISWVAAWVVGPCKGIQAGALLITPTGKDSDGDWLTPGTHTYTKTLTISDGTLLECAVSMIVLGPTITLAPTSDSIVAIIGGSGNLTSVVNIENTGNAGSTLNWENSATTGDAALTAILSLDTSSGALAKSASENVTITLTDPSSLTAGTYTATVTFRDSLLTTETQSFTLTLQVVPAYTGQLDFTCYSIFTNQNTPGPLNPSSVTGWLTTADENRAYDAGNTRWQTGNMVLVNGFTSVKMKIDITARTFTDINGTLVGDWWDSLSWDVDGVPTMPQTLLDNVAYGAFTPPQSANVYITVEKS